MIPYLNPGSIPVIPGVLEFHVFGLLVGIAVVFGAWMAQRRAEEEGLSPRVMSDGAIFFVITGFIVAHWFAVLFYYPERIFGAECATSAECFSEQWWGLGSGPAEMICRENGRCNNGSWATMLFIWNGISSVGGFLGAFIGILIFFRVKKIPLVPGLFVLEGGKGRPAMKYLDCAAYGMAFAWIFGRMACAMAHDHPGQLTTHPLSIRFPKAEWPRLVTPEAMEMFADVDYVQRFDLGFLEMLFAIVMSAVFFYVKNVYVKKSGKQLRPGWYVATLVFFYAPYRLFLDSLRAVDIEGADPRNALGLTPAQVSVIVMFVIAIAVWFYGGKLKKDAEYMSNKKFPLENEAPYDASTTSAK